ncbi:putative oxidation resistance protein 1-like isoform X1 [Capsicum annuum]|nr:putative oxidation resistance protein 1-like isoform X1 [Capsicum annuum]
MLIGGAKRSKILVTTRSDMVAEVSGCVHKHKLGDLSEEEAWTLFEKIAFEYKEHESLNLVEIGKEIMRKCGGAPLAIRSVGCLLHLKRTEDEWMYFKNQDLSSITRGGNDVMVILRLSYNYLPRYLKICFAYCSLFPKDFEIQRFDLVDMWIAQGFIKPISSNRDNLEDVANSYFVDLLRRSFFQEYDAFMQFYKMHDLIHDLVKEVADGEFFSIIKAEDTKIVPDQTFHASCLFETDGLSAFPNSFNRKHMKLRTFIYLNDSSYNIMSNSILERLTSLMHLDFDGCLSLEDMPAGVGQLTSLRTLSSFIIGKESCISGQASDWLNELKGLVDLRNSLSIKFLGRVCAIGERTPTEFGYGNHGDDDTGDDLMMLEALEPHQNIERLRIKNYSGSWFPSWLMVENLGLSLPKLVDLHIEDCHICQKLPPLWKLSSLRSLELRNLGGLEGYDVKFMQPSKTPTDERYYFSSLKQLELKGISEKKELTVDSVEGLATICEKEVGGDWPKIAHIPTVDIRGRGNDLPGKTTKFSFPPNTIKPNQDVNSNSSASLQYLSNEGNNPHSSNSPTISQPNLTVGDGPGRQSCSSKLHVRTEQDNSDQPKSSIPSTTYDGRDESRFSVCELLIDPNILGITNALSNNDPRFPGSILLSSKNSGSAGIGVKLSPNSFGYHSGTPQSLDNEQLPGNVRRCGKQNDNLSSPNTTSQVQHGDISSNSNNYSILQFNDVSHINEHKTKSRSLTTLDREEIPQEEIPNPTTRLLMNCIIWNIRGANNVEFKRHCKSMVQIHKPVILGLHETRMQDHKRISETLGFSNSIQFPATGNSVDLVLMWKDENINVTEISISPQVIYSIIQMPWLPIFLEHILTTAPSFFNPIGYFTYPTDPSGWNPRGVFIQLSLMWLGIP